MRTVVNCLATAALLATAASAAVPGQFQADKARARALLGEHRYAEARQLAQQLHGTMPDDLAVYALLVDADIGLGNLDDAEKQAQWMIDLGLRQPNVPGLVRVARLRMLFGDPEGALQSVSEALSRTPDTDRDRRATLIGFGGWLELLTGKTKDALAAADTAGHLSPGNACALAVGERARAAEGKPAPKPGDCPCDVSFY